MTFIYFLIRPGILSFSMHFIFLKLSRILLQKDSFMLSFNCNIQIKEHWFKIEIEWIWKFYQTFFDFLLLIFSCFYFFFFLFFYFITFFWYFFFELFFISFPSMNFFHGPIKNLNTSSISKVVFEVSFIRCFFWFFFTFSMFVSIFPCSYVLILIFRHFQGCLSV